LCLLVSCDVVKPPKNRQFLGPTLVGGIGIAKGVHWVFMHPRAEKKIGGLINRGKL